MIQVGTNTSYVVGKIVIQSKVLDVIDHKSGWPATVPDER